MKQVYSLIFLITLFSLLFCNLAFSQTKKALLIGINNYNPNDQTPASYAAVREGWMNPPLQGCINDVQSIKEIIMNRYGFKEKNIETLFDTQATNEKIKAEIQNLITHAQQGDTILFYYAGHGSRRKNSLSCNVTDWDQTIVPSNLVDIRDKELQNMFSTLADKGVTLTLIYDCCYSGHLTRGFSLPKTSRNRELPPYANDDIKDTTCPPAIYDKGALILSATKPDEEAQEYDKHGAFTYALIEAMKSSPVNESAENIINHTYDILSGIPESPQTPTIIMSDDRKKKGLFGETLISGSGKTLIPVISSTNSEEIILKGGYASGLNVNCVLRKVTTDDDTATIKITEVVSIGKCKASLVSGNLNSIKPNDLFECVLWASENKPILRVWIPTSDFTRDNLKKFCKNFFSSSVAKKYKWVSDPTKTAPQYVILFSDGNWLLSKPDGTFMVLGKSISAETLTGKIPKNDTVFLQLPFFYDSIKPLNLGKGSYNEAIEITNDPDSADYLLEGKYSSDTLCYAWVRPNRSEDTDSTYKCTLPLRTDWVNIDANGSINTLTEYTVRIGKIKAWLDLPSPPDNGSFPFSLAFIDSANKQLVTSGNVHEGRYTVTLVKNKEKLKETSASARRWVYIFSIDKKGKSTQIFPQKGEKRNINFLPDPDKFDINSDTRIKLCDIRICEPFGYDTYFLLSTDETLGDISFDAEGVMRGEKGAGGSALSNLLKNVGATTRGNPPPVPVNWSIQKLVVLSKEK